MNNRPEFTVVREDLTVYRLETLLTPEGRVIIRGLFDTTPGKIGTFAKQLDEIFDGFSPRQLWLYLEDDFSPYIKIYIRDKLKEQE